MNFIDQTGSFTTADAGIINANFALLSGLTQGQGSAIFLNPDSGQDFLNGLSPTTQSDGVTGPKRSLLGAYNAATAGRNDTIVLLANGATSATARNDSAFTWAKNATHLVGITAPVLMGQRARIAPSSTTTAFATFFTISASGCAFQNIQWFDGFTTGTTSQLGMVLTGQRNYFKNCHIAGMGDNESAQSAGSRSLKIGSGGSGENVFEDCTIGVDSIARTQANASVEFAGATARNVFKGCLFPFFGSAAGVLGILGTGVACMDRFQIFDNCTFINSVKSSSTVMTVLASLTSAAPGGLLLFKQCILVGIGEYGDANGLANSYIDGFTGVAGTSGIAVNPS